ncbi:flagellar biosynthetic protein FliO [Lysobacter sp. A289]
MSPAADTAAAAVAAATSTATSMDSRLRGNDEVVVPLPLPMASTHTASVAPAPMFAPPPAGGSGGAGAVGGGVLALLLVVALILGLAWLARRMPGMGVAGAGNPALRVVGSLALGPRDRVVVVEIGQTQLLLGVGPGGTRTLHTLDAPLPFAPNSGPSPFAQLLSQHFGKKP